MPIVTVLLAALAACASPVALAQTYPNRPIHLIAPFPAGGGYDFLSRLVGAEMSRTFGQPVVVENKSGANGNIGTDAAAKSAPDGYTLLMGGNSPLSLNVGLYPKLPYDPVRDFEPISRVATQPNLLAAHPKVPVKSFAELIRYARAHPGKLTGLAVASSRRSPLAPELPTLSELGYSIDIDTWYGLLAPAGTPKDIVAKLNAETVRIVNLPELKERTRAQGIELGGSTAEEFAAFMKADIAKWTKAIREMRVAID